METCQSPRTAMLTAYDLARQTLPDHTSKFSRLDFTLPQLFACLVIREMLRLSYRKTEVLLRDCMAWLAEIGWTHVPDHNTLWRAFGVLCTLRHMNHMLDLQVQWFGERRQLKLRRKPKLALAGAASCHLILSARVHLGSGSDAPDFVPLLRDARRRAPITVAVADSGFDSEDNHRRARQDMKVRSIIPAQAGRPSSKPPVGRWRRHMRRRFARRADHRHYGQRAQAETIHSMLKRNMGDALRSRLRTRRKNEMLFRTVVHNITLTATLESG